MDADYKQMQISDICTSLATCHSNWVDGVYHAYRCKLAAEFGYFLSTQHRLQRSLSYFRCGLNAAVELSWPIFCF